MTLGSRHLQAAFAVAIALALAALALAAPQDAAAAACKGSDKGPRKISNKTAAKAVACLVNKERRKHGKSRMKVHSDLDRAARGHSEAMQKSNCFQHQCPGEPDIVGRYTRADYLPCRCSWGAAENIGWGPGSKGTPRKIVDAWMKSSEHRANILGSFDHIGVGVRWGSPTKRSSNAGTYTLNFGYKR